MGSKARIDWDSVYDRTTATNSSIRYRGHATQLERDKYHRILPIIRSRRDLFHRQNFPHFPNYRYDTARIIPTYPSLDGLEGDGNWPSICPITNREETKLARWLSGACARPDVVGFISLQSYWPKAKDFHYQAGEFITIYDYQFFR